MFAIIFELGREKYQGEREIKMTDTQKKRKTIGIIVSIVVILVLSVFLFINHMSTSYRNRFLPSTYINNVDVSKLSAKKAEEKIAENQKNYVLKVNFRNKKTEKISAKEIDMSYVPDGQVEDLLKKQKASTWFKNYLFNHKGNKKTIKTKASYDADKLKTVLYATNEMKDENQIAPTNARLKYSDSKFTVEKEKDGNEVNKEVVYNAVNDAISKQATSINLKNVKDAYKAPSKTTKDVKNEAATLEKYMKTAITYELPNNQTEVLNSEKLLTWLVKNQDGTYSYDDENWNKHMRSFVYTLSSKANTVGKTHTFNATGLGVRSVSGGTYGYRMNTNEELTKLKSEISEGKTVKRAPAYSSKELTNENYGLGSNYIEVDLSRQHVWVYKNGNCVLQSDVVSGKMTSDRYTPAGTYYIYSKERNRVLRGTKDPVTGKYPYESPVSYWMPFNKGIGFHDANWRSSFGGNLYVNGGSHGCVNLPVSFAASMYNTITTGMPVVVYYSQGYSLNG